ncbi:MAG TPA: Mov34/MPN/PAD-1 family protein [Chloroflexota bacterium]|nr:Mov34/MPN/PAD-1 family protein [Chloroflexota bacterium]
MTSASTYSEPLPPPAPPPVNPTPEEVLNLPKRPSPLAVEACILHGQRPSAGQVVVVHSQHALVQIADHSESNLRSELGGVLLGHVSRDGDTLCVEIKATLPAHSSDRGPVHFTFNADAWSQIHRDRSAKYPHLDIVGWFHTHPGLGVFYSSDDAVVHSAAFTLPWHVGLVVDPVRQEAVYFGWQKGELAPALAPIAGYYELTDVQPDTVVPWKVVRTSVYNLPESDLAIGVYDSAGQSARLAEAAYAGHSQGIALSPSSRYLGLIVGSLALALALFMLLFWIVPLNRQTSQMQTVILNMANNNAYPNAAACPDPRLRLIAPMDGSAARVGSQVELIGTAVYPGTFRYQIDVRLSEQQEWEKVDDRRRPAELDVIGVWNTGNRLPGLYDVRLTAVDRNTIRLPNSPTCVIQVQLIQ